MIHAALKGICNHLLPKGLTRRQELLTMLIVTSLLSCRIEAQQTAAAVGNKAAANFDKVPLSFEINQGQTDAQVKFLSRGKDCSLFLTSDSAVFKLQNPALPQAESPVMKIEFLNTNQQVQVSGKDQLPGVANYFLGNNPKKWRSGIHTYEKVLYRGIYPGIDAVFYGNQRQLEYDFVVAPGADPKQISLGVSGLMPALDKNGNVLLKLKGTDMVLNRPIVYQASGAGRQIIDSQYLVSGNKIRFRLGKYDHNRELVIDPSFVFLTYLGGSNADRIGSSQAVGQLVNPSQALAIDSAGDVYVTGQTVSIDFPTANAIQTTSKTTNWTAFVSALDPTGSTLLYSTYLGGSAYNAGSSVAWDSASNSVYVVGTTASTDFPTTQGAFQMTQENPGTYSAFVTKFSSSGQITDSTFLGPGNTLGFGIATDSQGRAYVTGYTAFNCTSNPLSCFPTTQDAVIPSGTASGNGDGYVSVFDPSLSTILYSTLLGDPNGAQSFSSEAFGVAVDPNGNFYVVGSTGSSSLPTTPGAFQRTIGTTNVTPYTGFAAKFGPVSSNGASLTYLTYLGGPVNFFADVPSAVVADSDGNAYIGGYTGSSSFPVTAGSYQTTCSAFECAFVTKLNPNGTGLVWSTFLAAADYFGAIQIDAMGNVYATGHNNGSFPVVNAVQPNLSSGGGFIEKLDPSGSSLLFSSLIGGTDGQGSSATTGVAVDALGTIYVAGNLNDATLPTTLGVAQPKFAGGSGSLGDGFIAKIHLETPTLVISKSHTGTFTQGQTGTTYTITVSNAGDSPTTGSVSVTEAVPTGLTLETMSGTGWTCTTLPVCTRTDLLAAGTSYPPITATVNVAADAPANVVNTAYVSGGGAYTTNAESVSDPTIITQSALPDMTVAVTNGSNFVQAQTGATYTITVSNSGSAASTGSVAVSNTVPAGLTLVSMTGAGWTCTTLPVCTRADSLTEGTSYPAITATVNVASNAPANVTDQATVSGGGETNTANDTALDVTTVNGPPDLTIVKSHSGSFSQGQNGATYSITVGNAGTSPTSGTVTVNEAIPTGLTLVSMSGTGWNCSTLPTCTRADVLAAGGNYPSITVTVNVASNAPASVTNTVTVSGGGETNTANDSASDATSIAVVMQSQTITFPPIATQTYPVAPITLNATASSGLAVSYSVTAGPASVSGNILTITGGGSVTVQATQAGNASYSAAPAVSQTFAVNQAPSITSANGTTFVFGTAGSFTVSTSGYPAPSVSEAGPLPSGVTFINNGNGTGTLSGSPSVVGSFPISFTASNGVGSPATQSFSLSVSPASTTTSAQGASAAFSASSQTVTLTAMVTSSTGTVNSGTVTFTVPGVGTTTSGTVSGGTASAILTIPGGTLGGSYAMQAAYSGTTNLSSSSDNSKALTISGLASTTTGAAAVGTPYSLSSHSVTLMAEVFVGGMANVNGGTVTFTVSGIGSVTSGAVSNGQASAALVLPAGQAAGSYTITASYSGNTTYSPSSGTNTLNIFTAGTTTTAQSLSVNFSSSQQTVALKATVTSPVGTVNGGVVQFNVGGIFGTVISGTVTGGNASATFTIPAGTAPGVYSIQAVYEGTVSLNPSVDSSKTLTITSTIQATTTVAAPASATYSKAAQTITLQASVSGGSAPVNGGRFTFNFGKLGSATSGTVVNGSATATLTIPAGTDAGTYTGTVSYSGAPGFAPSSANASIVIVPAVPVITWPTPVAITYPTKLSAAQLDATANVPGKFTYSPAAGTVLNGGTQILKVTFRPANQVDYAVATAQVSLVVKKANTSLTINSRGGYVGEPVLVTAQVTAPNASGLGGTVTLQASTGESCKAIGPYYGGAFCFIVFNTAGTRTITGSYSGDINNNPSVSAPIQIVIQYLGG